MRRLAWLACLIALPSWAQDVSLSWQAPTQCTDGASTLTLSHYAIYRADGEAGPFEALPYAPGAAATEQLLPAELSASRPRACYRMTATGTCGASAPAESAQSNTVCRDWGGPGPVVNLRIEWAAAPPVEPPGHRVGVVNRTTFSLPFNTGPHLLTIPQVGVGNSLLVIISSPPDRAPTTITDNGGGTPVYTLDLDTHPEGGGNPPTYVWRRNGITTEPTQISFTTPLQAIGYVNVIEYDNLAGGGPVDNQIGTRNFSVDGSVTLTTALENAVGIGIGYAGTGRVITSPTTGYNAGVPSVTFGSRMFDNPDLGAAGSKTFQTTFDSAQWHQTRLITYETVGAGAEVDPDPIVQTQVLSAPSITQDHQLAPDDHAQAQAFSAPTVSQAVTADPEDQVQAQVFAAPALTQDHQIDVAGQVQAQVLSGPGVTQDHQLSPLAMAQLQALGLPALTQTHLLSAGAMVQTQVHGTASLIQDHQVTPVGLAQAQAHSTAGLTQAHMLAAVDLAQLQSNEAASLVITGVLSPRAIAQIQALGAVALTQDHQLQVIDLAQLQALSGPSVAQTATVDPVDLSQVQANEPVTIVVTGAVVPLSIVQQQALQAAQITQEHLVGVEDITQLQVFSAPSGVASGYLVVSSIRILPALSGEISIVPALAGNVSVKPH